MKDNEIKEIAKVLNEDCEDCKTKHCCKRITRLPQSWQYLEEM